MLIPVDEWRKLLVRRYLGTAVSPCPPPDRLSIKKQTKKKKPIAGFQQQMKEFEGVGWYPSTPEIHFSKEKAECLSLTGRLMGGLMAEASFYAEHAAGAIVLLYLHDKVSKRAFKELCFLPGGGNTPLPAWLNRFYDLKAPGGQCKHYP